jgi:hypothetical protein
VKTANNLKPFRVELLWIKNRISTIEMIWQVHMRAQLFQHVRLGDDLWLITGQAGAMINRVDIALNVLFMQELNSLYIF